MATTALGYPGYTGGAEAATFTRAQWKELERQAMIYKYIVASVPVPPHLLSSDTTSLGNYGCSSIYNLKYGNNKDAEPWRCKRTDGKKWRCSRDVAPHQKYCDRHMHRPRSRKPVEPKQQQLSPTTNKKSPHHLPLNNAVKSKAPPAPQELTIDNNSSSNLLKNVAETEDFSLSLNTQHPNRDLDWMMESKMMPMETSEQQWHQLMSEGSIYHTSTISPSIFQHNGDGKEEKELNLLNIPEIENSNTDEYNKFLNPYYTPRDFIDGWSNDNNPENDSKNESSGATNGNLSPSSLDLSMTMAVSDSFDSEMVQFEMGEGRDAYQRCQGSSWLSPVSWMGSASGGPLAEVLRPANVADDGDAISPLATSVSSPSGVLQRTILSLSDSSVCNSPTGVAASTASPEIAGFQWLN